MINTYTYVALGVLLLLLAGAGTFGYYQTVKVGELNQKLEESTLLVETKQLKIDELLQQGMENAQKLRNLSSEVQKSQAKQAKLEEKALKDMSRVQNVLDKKSKLYMRLVNKDYAEVQDVISEISQ